MRINAHGRSLDLPDKAVEAAAWAYFEEAMRRQGSTPMPWEEWPQLAREEAMKTMAPALAAFLRAWL